MPAEPTAAPAAASCAAATTTTTTTAAAAAAALQAWSALPEDQRADKDNFYRGQQRTAAGFMSLARKTLDLLIILTGDPAIVSKAAWRYLADFLLWVVFPPRMVTGPTCNLFVPLKRQNTVYRVILCRVICHVFLVHVDNLGALSCLAGATCDQLLDRLLVCWVWRRTASAFTHAPPPPSFSTMLHAQPHSSHPAPAGMLLHLVACPLLSCAAGTPHARLP